jgi:hypothetical protein
MKLKYSLIPILISLFLSIVMLIGCSSGSTTYYIDPANGDDKNSGLKEERAWRTFSHINNIRLSAGDRIEIISPGSFDHSLILTGAGSAKEPVSVRFAPGQYDFYPDNAYKEKYQISNTTCVYNNTHSVGILVKDARHFNISGEGATIMYHDKMIEMVVDSCENITMSGLSFDYQRPTISEYMVKEAGEDFVKMQVHKDSKYRIENGKIIWYGDKWVYNTKLLGQELDLESNILKRIPDPLTGMTFEEIEPFVIRGKGNHKMKSGRIYQLRETYRDCAAVFTRLSKNITWENIDFYYLHGMGLVSQFTENITYNNVSIAPAESSGRTTAAWADCIHISGCKGKIVVKDCNFSGAHDDAINIHGTYLQITEQISDKEIKVEFMHRQTCGFKAFYAGDEIEFIDWETLKSHGSNRVVTSKMLSRKEMILTLEKPIPAGAELKDVVENVTWTPEVEISGCTVSQIPTRGFVVKTRRKIVIENNKFLSTYMSAILIAHDAKSWYESGYVRDLTIRNNEFILCGEPVVNIRPEITVSDGAVHQNIRIENNEFFLRNQYIVGAKNTKNLSVTGNTVVADKILGDKLAIETIDCTDVKIEGNNYLIK